MKRATDTRDEGAPERPFKQIHTEEVSSTMVACFTNEFEFRAGDLTDTEELPEEKHILGQVFMLWPVMNNKCKVQLKTGSETLDVVFEGPGVESLGFMAKDMVRIALKGARKEAKQASSSMALPFKIIFSNGAMVQLLASQKREKDEVVDLFKVVEESKRRADEEWFYPPSAVGRLPETASDVPSQDNGVNKSQLHFHHNIDSVPRDTSLASVHRDTSLGSVFRGTSLEQPPHHKDKRIKKRDMRHAQGSNNKAASRHAQDSNNKAASDTSTTDPKNPAGSDVQKPLEKKANKKKRAAKLAHATIPAPAPLPLRDPALDLVAGFHSDKGGRYTPISQATHGIASLVGVVADVGETKVTRTGDCSKSFVLVDPSCPGSGITVTIFIAASDEELLPSARLGQVLLLRNVKVKNFADRPQGTCFKDSFQWCGYDPAQKKHFYTLTSSPSSPLGSSSVMGSNHDPFFKISAAELEYFVKISDWWRALNEAQQRNVIDDNQGTGNIHIVSQPGRSRRKVTTISEFEVGVFVDCVVEVSQLLDVWKGDINSTIYVTDYSENEHLYNHTDTQKFPIGLRTLTVTLWDGPHAMAEDLEVKSFYLLENIKVKVGNGGHLEGSIGYQDRGIRKIGPGSTQKNFPELLFRKKEYEKNPHHSRIKYSEEAQVPEPLQQSHKITRPEEPPGPQSGSTVECLHMAHKCSSIAELQQCIRCPNRFRIRARIIEYYPREIKDFVRVKCNVCSRILDDRYNLCPDCGDLTDSSRAVRYQFAIRVADQSGELNVNVSNEEADKFLTGLSARDARDDTEALKTRLSPLLGHLYKWHKEFDDKVKNDPGPWIDMCVYSWASDADEAVRLYKLFGCRLAE